MLCLLNIGLDPGARCDAVGKIGRGDAASRALADLVAYGVDGERHLVGRRLRRRRDRIKPRLQRIERFDEGFGIGPDTGKFLQRREHIERGGVAVRIAAGAERLGLLPPLAAGDVGNELEQHIRRHAERDAVGQHVAQGTPGDREIWRRAERGKHGIDQRRLVMRKHAERIADGVVDPAPRQIDIDMPRLFLRARLVEFCAGDEGCLGRMVSCRCRRGGRVGSGYGRRRLGGRRDGAEFGVERFEHARGVFAAGHAQVQPLFVFQDDGVGVILAIVAALAAILLAHGGHEPPPQRAAFGELHAVAERHGGVVPRRLPIVAIIKRAARRRRARPHDVVHQRRGLFRRQRVDAAIERQQPGEEAIEPGALLRRKRRGVRNERRDRRRRGLRHSTACVSNSDLSASTS